MNMTRNELGLQTPRSFHNKVKGFYDLEKEKYTNEEMLKRYQTGLLMNATGNYKKGVKIHQVWPIEEVDKHLKEQPIQTPEQIKEVIKQYAKVFRDE